MTKKICFVIQPFKSEYDKRYNDIYKPAIEAAGLKPDRVDKDLATDKITDDIERKIRESDICFADISLDNPNVWYELGYAHACGKSVIMVNNEDEREMDKLPFDIQVRSVLPYKNTVDTEEYTGEGFMRKITQKLVARMKIPAPKNITQNPNTSSPKKDEEIICAGVSLNKYDIKILVKILKHYHDYKEGFLLNDLKFILIPQIIINNSFQKLVDNKFIYKKSNDLDALGVDSLYVPLSKAEQFGRENIHLFEY